MVTTPIIRRGCQHDGHVSFCVELNATYCEACAAHVAMHHKDVVDDSGQPVRVTMVPAAQLSRLVTEDLARLRLTLSCAEQALYCAARDGVAANDVEDVLQREAARCRDDIDRSLLRIVQLVQSTRERLYQEVDERVSSRRAALLRLKQCDHEIRTVLNDVGSLLYVAGTAAGDLSQHATAALEEVLPIHIAAAEILSSVEERLVLRAESAIEALYPATDRSHIDAKHLSARDVMLLPNSHQVYLAPFKLRINATLVQAELDRLTVRDSCGNKSVPTASSTPQNTAEASDSVRAAGKPNAGSRQWKSYHGLGKDAASRRRNVKTPPVPLV